jgi:hypothetical protein
MVNNLLGSGQIHSANFYKRRATGSVWRIATGKTRPCPLSPFLSPGQVAFFGGRIRAGTAFSGL